MKIMLHLFLFFIFTTPALAQSRETIRIKPGDDAREALQKEVYRYPQFLYGKAYFANGDVSAAKMNYNYLGGNMEFIDAKGDTLFMAAAAAVVYVSIGADTFYYDKDFLEKWGGNGKTTFAVRKKLSFADVQKIGGYGIPSSTANIESKDSYTDKRYRLAINEELVVVKKTLYYMRKGTGPFVAVTKKNVLRLYPGQKKKIETYLSEKQLNLDEEEGVQQFINYVTTL